ncbi:hypothetical protein CsSME_00016298 [Camellia sinensis var. sinensis]
MEFRILYDDILHRNATYESLGGGIKVQVVLFFCKWCHVGNNKIRGSKLEDMSKSDAI